ncbi:hypothetical protein B0H14DRAFT_3460532 [Mycena olivaceomarginata]|nr:hypothetical protein B0H14DRAFT_3460532 [Mycena olivaceomarginata]
MGHDRTPVYPHDQAPSRRHCRIPCTKLLANLLPLLLHVLVAHSVFPAARVLHGGVASPRFTLPRVGIRTALGSLTPRRTPAPACAAQVHLRVCMLGGGRPRAPTPPSSCPPFRSMSHLSFRGAAYFRADGNHVFCAPMTDCAGMVTVSDSEEWRRGVPGERGAGDGGEVDCSFEPGSLVEEAPSPPACGPATRRQYLSLMFWRICVLFQ